MNIVYSQFSDIGEYFNATKGARDFDAAPRGMTGDTSFIQKVVETVKAIPGNIVNETSRRLEAKEEPKWTDPIHTTDYVAKRKDVWEAQDRMMKPVAEYNKAVESVPEAVRQSTDSTMTMPEGFDTARLSTPSLGESWLGKIDPTDGVLSNAEILTGAGVGTAAALALGLGVKKHLKDKKELKKAQEYFREHPRAKKAAGFSEKEVKVRHSAPMEAISAGALGAMVGAPTGAVLADKFSNYLYADEGAAIGGTAGLLGGIGLSLAHSLIKDHKLKKAEKLDSKLIKSPDKPQK